MVNIIYDFYCWTNINENKKGKQNKNLNIMLRECETSI